MAKEGNTTLTPLWRDLLSVEVYKRSQGRICRQVTFGALALVCAAGAWSLRHALADSLSFALQYGLSGGLLVGGLWLSFRVVNLPRFADFLIAVEAEMNKVSWPSRTELVRSSIVVIVVMIALAALLYFFDFFWQFLLHGLGVIG